MAEVNQPPVEVVIEDKRKCSRCKSFHTLNKFKIKTNGALAKQCNRCANVMAMYRINTACKHGQQKASCVRCRGLPYKPRLCDKCNCKY